MQKKQKLDPENINATSSLDKVHDDIIKYFLTEKQFLSLHSFWQMNQTSKRIYNLGKETKRLSPYVKTREFFLLIHKECIENPKLSEEAISSLTNSLQAIVCAKDFDPNLPFFTSKTERSSSEFFKEYDGVTPLLFLSYAYYCKPYNLNHYSLIKSLLLKNANPNEVIDVVEEDIEDKQKRIRSFAGDSAIHMILNAIKYEENNVIHPTSEIPILRSNKTTCAILKLLLTYGADPNTTNHSDEACLHIAIQLTPEEPTKLHWEMIDVLLQYGADIHEENADDETAYSMIGALRNPPLDLNPDGLTAQEWLENRSEKYVSLINTDYNH